MNCLNGEGYNLSGEAVADALSGYGEPPVDRTSGTIAEVNQIPACDAPIGGAQVALDDMLESPLTSMNVQGKCTSEDPVAQDNTGFAFEAELDVSGGSVASPSEQDESEIAITVPEFMSAVFGALPEGYYAAVASFPGDPKLQKGWTALRYDKGTCTIDATTNNYVACSSYRMGYDGSFNAKKDRFGACCFAMFDDIGTKVPHERFRGMPPSWRVETSPGNFQYGFIFKTPIQDGEVASLLFDCLTDQAGLGDKGASGAMYRWARLPIGINGKEKYKQDDGTPFQCRLVTWQPGNRYEWSELFDYYLADIAKDVRARIAMKSPASGNTSARARRTPTVIDPAIDGAGDQIISSLRARELYKKQLETGIHDITCPWLQEHTDGIDDGTRYFEPSDEFPRGGFKCHHGHCADRHLRDLLEFLGVKVSVSEDRPVIDIVAGELHVVVDRAEEVLAKRGQHFQAGGSIISIGIDDATGDPSIVPTNVHALTRELSEAAVWRRWDARAQDWRACDPSERHVHTLFEGQKFCHLPVLTGLARQPLFREIDGELVVKAGYDQASGKYGVFDPGEFPTTEPTQEAAREALKLLQTWSPSSNSSARPIARRRWRR
jgi:hypothetical protein